jgi:hypothetical protein
MAYIPTTYVNNDLPAIAADNLNKLENAMKDAHDGKPVVDATAKETPVDADVVGLIDSVASNALKKLSWANIKATLKTYFETLFTSKPTVVTTLTGGAVTIADNTIYTFTGVTSMAVTFPTGDYECLMDITTGTGTITITFPAGTKYLSEAPTFEASKRYEISIRNGIVGVAEVV